AREERPGPSGVRLDAEVRRRPPDYGDRRQGREEPGGGLSADPKASPARPNTTKPTLAAMTALCTRDSRWSEWNGVNRTRRAPAAEPSKAAAGARARRGRGAIPPRGIRTPTTPGGAED